MDDGNSVTTKLLTLLNVSATRVGKKKDFEEFVPSKKKLNKRKSSITFAESVSVFEKENAGPTAISNEEKCSESTPVLDEEEKDDLDLGVEASGSNGYESQYGLKPKHLTEPLRSTVDAKLSKNYREKAGKLGPVLVSVPQNSEGSSSCSSQVDILDSLSKSFRERQSKPLKHHAELQNDLLSTLATRKDLYITSTPLATKIAMREAIALHALDHVTRKRRKILKNNERLAKVLKNNPDAPPPEDVQDQGFTRPAILVLLPFRSSAHNWFQAFTSHTPTPTFQIENQSRFLSEYALPEGVVDKLLEAEPGTYPPDHVDTFKGNLDDNFRVGVKLTKKTVKMFAEFYGCDIILASPLGLRRSIEKEKHADYLTSIEMLIVDQMDALTMQNWEHVKFVLSHLNKLPKESHDTDFSRIKPWFLDGHAHYLRQSILLSAYETPDTRSLFNSSLRNVAGKIRTEKRYKPIEVPAGIDQNFSHFDCTSPTDEPDKRFHHFTTQILPSVLKSAVQSTNTIIFVPSSYDFIRVHNHFRKQVGVTFSVLSEYSTNQEISRARQSFFKSTSSFLLISERFHFFRRYKIRGARNVIFYAPPDHSQFYSEYLSYPFLDDGVEGTDVTCRLLYSKYDKFSLERIVGSETVNGLLQG
ncbi:digestive organ expansion factor [Crepidotus variabilis]|uniref:U3 small nucleolar RNA-associated protein 25 n=1 Tax=Crepidotus variabilis TaxID=179855 RepID=A0A9P6E6V0_9AGAR|nr:digestive organ expansion factor [Crepidotus variabilis]